MHDQMIFGNESKLELLTVTSGGKEAKLCKIQ